MQRQLNSSIARHISQPLAVPVLRPGCVKLAEAGCPLSNKVCCWLNFAGLQGTRVPMAVSHGHSEPIRKCQAAAYLWIQDIHCCPLPRGPPAKIWKTGVILAIAPPSLASTMPVRTCVGRTPQPGSNI